MWLQVGQGPLQRRHICRFPRLVHAKAGMPGPRSRPDRRRRLRQWQGLIHCENRGHASVGRPVGRIRRRGATRPRCRSPRARGHRHQRPVRKNETHLSDSRAQERPLLRQWRRRYAIWQAGAKRFHDYERRSFASLGLVGYSVPPARRSTPAASGLLRSVAPNAVGGTVYQRWWSW